MKETRQDKRKSKNHRGYLYALIGISGILCGVVIVFVVALATGHKQVKQTVPDVVRSSSKAKKTNHDNRPVASAKDTASNKYPYQVAVTGNLYFKSDDTDVFATSIVRIRTGRVDVGEPVWGSETYDLPDNGRTQSTLTDIPTKTIEVNGPNGDRSVKVNTQITTGHDQVLYLFPNKVGTISLARPRDGVYDEMIQVTSHIDYVKAWLHNQVASIALTKWNGEDINTAMDNGEAPQNSISDGATSAEFDGEGNVYYTLGMATHAIRGTYQVTSNNVNIYLDGDFYQAIPYKWTDLGPVFADWSDNQDGTPVMMGVTWSASSRGTNGG